MKRRITGSFVGVMLFALLVAVGPAFAEESPLMIASNVESATTGVEVGKDALLGEEADAEDVLLASGGASEGPSRVEESQPARDANVLVECFEGAWEKADGRWRYVVSGESVANAQVLIDGKMYFFDAEGFMCSGWKKHEGEWYYLGSSDQGAAQSGWLKWGSAWYFLDADTKAMVRGWQTIGSRYYFGEGEDDGAMATGWRLIDDDWYYFGSADDGVVKTGWLWWGGAWRCLDSAGAMITGWLEEGGARYYLDPANDGVMARGWLKVDGAWYYASASGVMQTGWLWWNDAWYYLDPLQDGAMATGLLSVGGESYFCKDSGALCLKEWVATDAANPNKLTLAGSSGRLLIDAVLIDGERLVVESEDVSSGWFEVDGVCLYLDGQDSRVVRVGWVNDGGSWYYLGVTGIMQTGWVQWNGAWYYLGSNGVMRTGWLLDGEYWYYLRADGSMVSNATLTIGGESYSFGSDGVWSAQRDIYRSAFSTGTTGYGRCAEWVSRVYYGAGWRYLNGDARDMYWGWCWSSNREDLAVGMTVGVPTSKASALGRIYGHVGIYIGNGMVRHNVSGVLVTPLDEWIETYYVEGSSAPRWGFPPK